MARDLGCITVRMFARANVGGRRIRLQLSNLFGTAPLVLGHIHIPLHGQGSGIVKESDRAVLFSGKPDVYTSAAKFSLNSLMALVRPICSRWLSGKSVLSNQFAASSILSNG